MPSTKFVEKKRLKQDRCVKNIPNLIVFGARNRRNMMDEAFLQRTQAKVFVGRPSPAIRINMLTPLICKNS
ncbi:unnamed protein product [Didymodactylos carnosus]|uniref:Uncharacterized protein n=1 Tax=Didymodactylos carnosus TaxID=1234261 RepID=A0A815UQP3_9BILA|nr:unnamed protein product [Didymodactylos carnosus]CAF4385104.1 unnamed protein product [Didymodactylos carnosus]